MGYVLIVYCEPDIYFKEEIVTELTRINPDLSYPLFAYKSGFNFFFHYQCYKENSFIYQFCTKIDNSIYEFTEALDYVEGLRYTLQKGTALTWHNLTDVKHSLDDLIEKLRIYDIASVIADIHSDYNDYFREYISRNDGHSLLDNLSLCKEYIRLFERHGARQILFTYS